MRPVRTRVPRNLNVVFGFAALFLPAGAATAQGDYMIHPLLEGQGQHTSLTVPDNGKVLLSLTRSGSGADSIDLYVSSFGDQQGNSVEVSLEVAGLAKSPRHVSVTVDRPVLPVSLDVPSLPSAGGFAGQLFLYRGQSPIKSYLIVLTRAAAAQYQVRPLAEDAAAQTTLTVPMDGKVPLLLTRSEGGPDSLSLQLSPFTDERGNEVDVKIEIPEMPGRASATQQDSVQVGRPVLPLRLVVPGLPTPGHYKGQLFLTRQQSLLKSYSFALTRATTVSPAKLLLDQQVVNLIHTRRWFWGSRGPEFTVHLREESGEWPLEGLFARPENVQAPSSAFDLSRDLKFWVNDSPVTDFWRWPPKPGEEMPACRAQAGQQVAVRGQFHGLAAGDYTVKIRFTALNSQADDRQLLTLNLKVRDAWFWAALTLVVAALLSFVSTKVLRQHVQRLQFLRRIAEVRPEWLQSEPPTLAVVWTRALLKLTERLCRKYLFTGSDDINTRIGQLEQILKKGGPLERISNLRMDIDRLPPYPMVIRRARKCLCRICDRLGTPPFDENLSNQIGAELDELEAWLDPSKLADQYWKDLQPDIDRLLGEVPHHVEVFPARVRPVVEELIKDLPSTRPDDGLAAMVERENAYAALNLLWDRRDREELEELAKLQREKQPIETLFEVVDRHAWERLKRAKIRLVGPMRASPERFQVYQPLQFKVVPDDPWLRDNYLFKHVVEYRWKIQIQRITPWHRKLFRKLYGNKAAPEEQLTPVAPEEQLTPLTYEPRVIQYAPWAGRLTASVILFFRGQEVELRAAEPPLQEIGDSSVFARSRALNRTEVLASVLTLILGVATGLFTYYVGNATFGSTKDYLSLLLWGAGADQAKNFVQLLGGSATGGEAPHSKS